MRAYPVLFLSFVLAASAAHVAGCGDDPVNVASLELRSNLIIGGELAVPKDKSVIVGIIGRDPGGEEVKLDLAKLEWKTTDDKVIEVKHLGDACLITGLHDWFDSPNAAEGSAPPAPPAPEADAGADAGTDGGAPPPAVYGVEPSTTLTVSYGNAKAVVKTHVILNVAGTWKVVVDDKATQELELDQQGRGILYSGTAGGAKGRVEGNAISLEQQGVQLTGTFSSRSEASGTFTGPGEIKGGWKAQKQP